ncbi:MAG: transcription elongation factor GreB, partial [Deltaproteobacteria bacterium]
LWEERRKVTAMVSAAAAEGDRSENAEYIYGKKRLRELDSRLRFLGKAIESAIVVEPRTSGDKVYFGAWVTVEDEQGRKKTWRIVGPHETDSEKGYISTQSPVGRALLGKQVGDAVEVDRPGGTTMLYVLDISYSAPEGRGG